MEQNHLCNFGRGHHEEHFCEIIFNLDQWFRRRCHLKDLLTKALAALIDRTIYAILVEGIIGNNLVKLI